MDDLKTNEEVLEEIKEARKTVKETEKENVYLLDIYSGTGNVSVFFLPRVGCSYFLFGRPEFSVGVYSLAFVDPSKPQGSGYHLIHC